VKDVCIWLTGLFQLAFLIRYVYQLRKKQIDPSAPTWTIFLAGTALSITTYLLAENRDVRSGILNTVDAASCLLILVFTLYWGDRHKQFDRFEKWCLVGAGGIVLFWAVSRQAWFANLITQGLITVGYAPTFRRMHKLRKKTESFTGWMIGLATGCAGLYPAIKGGNTLATVYAIRTIVMISAVLIVTAAYHFRAKKAA
jgi:hypothetical protein